MPSSCRIYYVVFDIQLSWGILGWWSHMLLSSCSFINVIISLGIIGRWSNKLQSLQHGRSWTWCSTCFLIIAIVWALLEDEATSFNPFALLSTTYILLHGRSWMMKPHASILLPIHLESSRSSAVLSVSFAMQLECIYISCLHRWTSTLRSTWTRSPFRNPWMKSSNSVVTCLTVRECDSLIDQFYQRERWTRFYPVRAVQWTICVWTFYWQWQ